MLVLQDFEALTPNILARTVETVEGGGVVVLLLSTLSSLSQLYSLTMDVHSRLRTESHYQVTGRFNERMVLSLGSTMNAILMDDELNILPTSSLVKHIKPLQQPGTDDGNDGGRGRRRGGGGGEGMSAEALELHELTETLSDTQPIGSLVAQCKTLDQARAVVTFLDAASEKTLRSTVALTAARGRGKSAALGLAIAGALGLGYSNIFVTAPSPENLRTLFEFIVRGLDGLGYAEHVDYEIVESTNPAFGRAPIRVNVFKTHRQTVQYVQPQHVSALAQAELLVIDEAAAIPLPLVKSMLGPYLVFLCSTVNGYEGTGRSLSLKLISQLREQSVPHGGGGGYNGSIRGKDAAAAAAATAAGGGAGGRAFREVTLREPIRYAAGDGIESWLNGLLCLDAADHTPPTPPRLPHPTECDLYFIERDTLFSYHKASEEFLQQMMSLYVSSHYKNTPNDLLLMSDAPAHRLFVLLGPVDESRAASLPDILAVAQVALEGEIGKAAAKSSLASGQLPQGDLIPWIVGQQFQDYEFPRLSGARIVRIAVHPDAGRAGYGSRTLELLQKYYQGEIANMQDDEDDGDMNNNNNQKSSASLKLQKQKDDKDRALLLQEQLKPRSGLPPLLVNLADRPPEHLHYIGTSFGMTLELFNFWKKSGFRPVYLRQTASDVTGEHTIIMLKELASPDVTEANWTKPFVADFRSRFTALLGTDVFRKMSPALALSLLDPKLRWSESESRANEANVSGSVPVSISPYDLKRIHAYASNLVDHHLILDLVPTLSRAYFEGKLPATLSYGQAAILLMLGLQFQQIGDVETALGLPGSQALALFNKTMRKLHSLLEAAKEAEVSRKLPKPRKVELLLPRKKDGEEEEEGLDEELERAGREAEQRMREHLEGEDLEEFAIKGSAEEFKNALGESVGGGGSGIVSLKGKVRKKKKEEEEEEEEKTKQKRQGTGVGVGSGKKKRKG
jgi:N-acetyltransferase 10